jgi:hypothetical protein
VDLSSNLKELGNIPMGNLSARILPDQPKDSLSGRLTECYRQGRWLKNEGSRTEEGEVELGALLEINGGLASFLRSGVFESEVFEPDTLKAKRVNELVGKRVCTSEMSEKTVEVLCVNPMYGETDKNLYHPQNLAWILQRNRNPKVVVFVLHRSFENLARDSRLSWDKEMGSGVIEE